jgi:integrase
MVALYVPDSLKQTRTDLVTPAQLDALYEELLARGRRDGQGGLSPRTVRYVHTVLRLALSRAWRHGLTATNPALAAEPPSARAAQSYAFAVWSPLELRRFLAAARHHPHYAAFHLAASTGLRRGELLGLRWSDLNLDQAYLQVIQNVVRVGNSVLVQTPKSARSRRRVDLDRQTVNILRSHEVLQRVHIKERDGSDFYTDFVFSTKPGVPMHPELLSYFFNRAVRIAGLRRIRLHDLRHTHATHALQAGIHPKIVSERLGHSSVSITLDTYSHVLPSMQRDAAEAVAALVAG